MFDLEKNCKTVLLFFLVVTVWFLVNPNRGCEESFNADVTEFVPVGDLRHDLRGYPLTQADAARIYMSPNRQIHLSQAGGEISITDQTPAQQGYSGCKKVTCPTFPNSYDSQDTCWQCSQPDNGPGSAASSPSESGKSAYEARLASFNASCKPFVIDGADVQNVPIGWPNKPFPSTCSQ